MAGLGLAELDWVGLGRLGRADWTGHDRTGQDRKDISGQDMTGHDMTGMIYQDRTGQDRIYVYDFQTCKYYIVIIHALRRRNRTKQ